MVIKLLSLSIWMSVAMLAMDDPNQNNKIVVPPKVSQVRVKPPKLYTGIEENLGQIVRTEFHDGLMQGRKESEQQLNALRAEQQLLLQLVDSKAETIQYLTYDVQKSQKYYQELFTQVATISQKLSTIIGHNKSFRLGPLGDKVQELHDEIEKLKKLVI